MYQEVDYDEWSSQDFPWSEKVNKILKETFKKEKFFKHQLEAINITLSKKDLFLILATGYGKSMIFQVAALADSGLTLVIMPLLSLIQDQLVQMQSLGVQIESSATHRFSKNRVLEDGLKLFITTPEKLISDSTMRFSLQDLANQGKLSRIVIDEAHCVSHWGRQFRDDYLHLSSLRDSMFPKDVPIIAMTATATQYVRSDVIQILRMDNCYFIQGSMNRQNIYYDVRRRDNLKDGVEDIYKFIKGNCNNQQGIIYCLTQNESEEVANELKQYGITTASFHAGKDVGYRNEVQIQWMLDEIQVIVATVAFGLGINKKDCRFVMHFQMPFTVDNYLQESGRAGRDQLKAYSIIYYNQQDYLTNMKLTFGLFNKEYEFKCEKVSQIQFYCLNTITCRRALLMKAFDEPFDPKDCYQMCSICDQQQNAKPVKNIECIDYVKQILYGLQHLRLTQKQLCSLLKGLSIKASSDRLLFLNKTPLSGLLKDSREIVDKLVESMISDKLLVQEQQRYETQLYTTSFITLIPQLPISVDSYVLRFQEQQKNTFQKVDEKTKIMQQRSNQNFANYLKKNKTDTLEIPEIEKYFNLESYIYKYRIIEKLKNADALIETLKEQNKKFIWHPLYGYCNENQFTHLSEKIKLQRKELYYEMYLKNKKQEIQIYPQEQVMPSIESVISNEDITELCRKLPSSMEELEQDEIQIPQLIKEKEYMKEIIKQINQFGRIEKIDKSVYYLLNSEEINYEKKISQKVEENKQEQKIEQEDNQLKRSDPISNLRKNLGPRKGKGSMKFL